MNENPDLLLPADLPSGLFIDGAWRGGERGSIAVDNPSTGETVAYVADAGLGDARAALDAAVAAQDSWRRTPARARAELLRLAFDAVIARTDDLARIMSIEMGKPLDQARSEVTYGAEFLRWFSEIAAHSAGSYRPSPEGHLRQLVVKRPVGPSLLITPWNFPLAMATRKVAPALAAGCTIILRPAALTPLTLLLFVKILADIGLPAGVVNVVTSIEHDVTDLIIADPRLRKLSFTGSTAVGQQLLRQAAQNVLKCSMELGGNAPFLVFEDADLDAAVEGAVQAKLRNMGEACTAANRMLVHQDVADEFARRLAARFAKMVVGNSLDDNTEIGPVITHTARAGIDELVQAAVSQGARVLTGGRPVPGAGWFYPPTVLADVPTDATILTEEIFGPVAPITSFATEDEALRYANATAVGLASYVFTRDLPRAMRVLESLDVGIVGLNTGLVSNAAAPFGGVKQSGLGREGGDHAIDEFLEETYVALPNPFS